MEEGSEVGGEEDVTITSDCSDYPLHNTSILDKLLYSEPHPSSKGSSYDSEEVTLPAESVVSMMEEETKHLVQGVPTNAADHDSHTPQQDRHLSQHDDQNLQVSQPRKGLGVQGEAKEKRILRILGMDRLTWLGSVRSVRVEVSVLELDQHALMSHWQDVADTGIDQSVFFVEYHFPLTTKFTSSKEPIAQEVMRVASKRMKSGIVAFNHCSSFPISFTSSAILTWWGESLLFRIYARPPHHRMPLLFGKCSLELQRLLTSRVGREQFQLKIYPATLSDSVMPISHTPTGRPIGILQVEVQLVCKGKGRVLPDVNPLLNSSAESAPTEEHGTKTIVDTNPINGSESVCQFLAAPKHTDPSMTTLQLLLFLPDAVGVSLPSHNMEGVSPNCYIICRMFCTGRPPPVTDITWNSSDPSFNFKLSIPLVLSSSLLSNLQNGVLVVEVWHKTPGTTTNDMLIGLVKVSLSQFFLAYNDSSIWKSMVKLDYPVIGMDSYCPIVSPFTTSVHGHLGVLLALGTSTQVTSLLQHYAGGKYILQRPYSASGPSVTAHSPLHDTVTVRPPKPSRNEDTLGGDELDTTSHVLRITIRAVKNLSSLNSEIWGASDCFVQYHFPSQHMQSEGTSPAKAPCPYIPHRTPTIMCVADPIFNQEMVHAYTLPSSHSLEHVLLSACPSSSVPFQVWKRYYYPNIRDQLVAKGVLQLAKVCAVISMSRSSLAESKHTYTIPLTSTTSDSARAADGVLELSVSYSRASHTTTSEEVPVVPTSMVTLSIGVLRACGLKDVVAAALEREPSLLVQPAQVGVNSFVRLTLPFSCSKKQMQTKSIAQSFCPEYSHQFDLSLPLTPDHHRGGSFVQELLEGRQCVALFEVYHKVLKSPVKTAAGRDVTARHLRVPPEEVLLGSVELDLHQLLSRESGIRGWVPLCLSTSPDARGRKAGGLEVSIQFPSQHHRDLVVQEALQQGFSPPCAPWNKMAAAKLCLTIGQVGIGEECITYAASSIARKLCYLRYKVYDKNPVMTRVVKAATVHRGMASYELGHQSKAHVATSEELTWYLKEEELEVQVWLTASSNQSSVRPSSSDVLFGSCFVPLSGLLSDDPVVKGCYTLFKSGADTTGNGFVQLTVSLQEGSLSGVGKDLHITETDKESSTQPSTSTATSSLIPSAQPSTEGECVKKDSDLLNRIKEANLFDCCVVIHQAAIAQDCAM
jgi:C2 domain-containing protein 3